MTLRRLWPLGLLVLALAVAGCSNGGRKNPPDAFVRVLNVVPSVSSLLYRRGQVTSTNSASSVAYQDGSTTFVYDEDTYNFTVATVDLATIASKDLDTFSLQIVAGTLYTFVYVESGGAVTHTILESPPLPSSTANALVQATHGDEALPTIDLYLVAPDTDVATTTPWGTIGFKQSLTSREVTAGVYELVVTAAGNPANVLYRTGAFTMEAGSNNTLALSPDAGEGIAPLNVILLNGTASTPLIDPSLPSQVRALNGATDQMPRDVAFNNEFTPPQFSNVAFATPTPYAPLTASVTTAVNVTPVGNPGVLELSSAITPVGGKMSTMFFTGDAGALILSPQQDNRRRIAGQGTITFFDAAPVDAAVEILVLAPGTDASKAPVSLSTIVSAGSVLATAVAPDNYEISLRATDASGTSTIVGGPFALTVVDKGLYEIFLSNDANGTSIDQKLIGSSP